MPLLEQKKSMFLFSEANALLYAEQMMKRPHLKGVRFSAKLTRIHHIFYSLATVLFRTRFCMMFGPLKSVYLIYVMKMSTITIVGLQKLYFNYRGISHE